MNQIMRRALLLISLLFGLVLGLEAKDFEGSIELSIQAKGTSTAATAFIKGQGVKIVPKTALKLENGVEGYPIIDFAKKKLTLVSPKDKYYLDMPLAQFENAIAAQPVTLKKTGKSETILGYAAEEWTVDTPATDQTVSFWASNDLELGLNLLLSLQKSYPVEGLLLGRMAKVIADAHGFPLRAVVSDKSGQVSLSWQILKITPGQLAEGEVAIPPGYGKMSEVLKKNRGAGGR